MCEGKGQRNHYPSSLRTWRIGTKKIFAEVEKTQNAEEEECRKESVLRFALLRRLRQQALVPYQYRQQGDSVFQLFQLQDRHKRHL